MKFWLIVILGCGVFWFLTDVSSESGFRSLVSPLICNSIRSMIHRKPMPNLDGQVEASRFV